MESRGKCRCLGPSGTDFVSMRLLLVSVGGAGLAEPSVSRTPSGSQPSPPADMDPPWTPPSAELQLKGSLIGVFFGIELTAQGKSPMAQRGMVQTAKALAASAIELIETPALVEAARRDLKERNARALHLAPATRPQGGNRHPTSTVRTPDRLSEKPSISSAKWWGDAADHARAGAQVQHSRTRGPDRPQATGPALTAHRSASSAAEADDRGRTDPGGAWVGV